MLFRSRDNLSSEDALEIVKKRYQENKLIYKKLYDFDFGENLSVFDKIINTDGLSANEVLSIVKSAIKNLL